jgi:uncharacterized protein (TIGR02246 family)
MTTNDVPAADLGAVAALPQKLLTAWAQHDADGIADLFTEDGTLILPGIFKKNREEIREFFKSGFATHYNGTRVVGEPIGLRFLGPDIALLLSSGGVLAPGDTEVSDAQAIRASWLAIRTGAEWKLAAYQNSPANRGLPLPGSDA